MHEMGIAANIYELAQQSVSGHGPGRLLKVRVAIGELSAVEPDLLRYAWEATTSVTPDAGCEMEVEWHPARQFCPSCKQDRSRSEGSWLRICTECGGPLRVEGGTELDLLQIEYDSEEDE